LIAIEQRPGNSTSILSEGIIPLSTAAAALGIDPKRLLGYCLSSRPWMPIAGQTDEGVMVYGWSLRHVAERISVGDSDVNQPAIGG
jgi:hypothetical protein